MPPRKSAARTSSVEPPTEPKPQQVCLPEGEPGNGRVFLIDTYSFIFRAYHAMARTRGMSTRKGVPTSATYVFVNMLRKLIADFHPEYIAALFEGGPTFRDESAKAITSVRKFDIKTQSFQDVAYEGYKANRSSMPADLTQQVPYIRAALDAFRIPMLELAGYEADDVIGTLAKKAADAGHPVYVVSSDKDMLQLVNSRIAVLNPPKDNLICDAAKVEELLGVPPERVVDVMALRGDSIDNIPGAPGVGDKGSVEIVRRFGSLDAALEHAEQIEKKTYRESLLNNRETILWSKEMVTIRCDLDIPLDLDAMTAKEPDREAALALFTELEFTSLIKEFLPASEVRETEYRDATSASEIDAVVRGATSVVAVAIEGVGSNSAAATLNGEDDDAIAPPQRSLDLFAAAPPAPPRVDTLALSTEPGKAVSAKLDSGATGDALRRTLSDEAVPKAIHDAKAAMHALSSVGVELRGLRDEPALYSYLLNPTYSSHTLPEIALRSFNLQLSGSIAEAADMTGRMATALRTEVEAAGLMPVYEGIDLPLVPVLFRMEAAGVKVDCDVLRHMSARFGTECDRMAAEIHGIAGEVFNINSPKKLGEVLFEKLGLPKPVKYGKGKTISTAADVLESLAAEHEIARKVLDFRQVSKLKSTYVDALPQLLNSGTNRLHTTFEQANTATGRLSSRNPNLQNIPIRTELGREIRAAFVAEPGNVLLSADYSQIELRLLAHFSGDPLLVEAFRRNDDIHTITAAAVFGLTPDQVTPEHRRRAKAVNFGIVYGQTPFGLAQALGIEQREARAFIETYFEKYSGVRKWLDEIVDQARRDQMVSTLHGRVRPIPDIQSKNPNLRGFAERTAMNTPLQGTAADLIKLAMINLDRELRDRKLRSRMTLQVHDELVLEVPEDEIEGAQALVRDAMENVESLRVPLVVEIGVGTNWRDI